MRGGESIVPTGFECGSYGLDPTCRRDISEATAILRRPSSRMHRPGSTDLIPLAGAWWKLIRGGVRPVSISRPLGPVLGTLNPRHQRTELGFLLEEVQVSSALLARIVGLLRHREVIAGDFPRPRQPQRRPEQLRVLNHDLRLSVRSPQPRRLSPGRTRRRIE
jgi:hypothetical protein